MANISETYGSNFHQEAKKAQMEYATKLLASNLANRNFNFRLNTRDSLWNENNMHNDAIYSLMNQCQKSNPKLRLTHVKKHTQMVNMFPQHVVGPVEYFVLTDFEPLDSTHLYSITITPDQMCAL